MRTYLKLTVAALLALLMTGCATMGNGIPSKRYTGLITVQESAEVWDIYDETMGDDLTDMTRFAQELERALDDGRVQPVPFGDFIFSPYDNGHPYGEPYVLRMKSEYRGVRYFYGDSEYFMPGRAICVTVPKEWGAIAHIRRFPGAVDSRTNCYDFGHEALNSSFARTAHTAATIVVVRPQDYGRITSPGVTDVMNDSGSHSQTVLSSEPVTQRLDFANGFVNEDGVFVWSRGGGAPLQEKWKRDGFREALALDRLNLDSATQRAIRDRILNTEPEYIDLRRYKGEVLNGIMLSADGEIVTNPKIATDQWFNTKFGARTWFVTVNRSDGSTERWQVIVPDVCGNLILIPRSGALPCICDPETDFCVEV